MSMKPGIQHAFLEFCARKALEAQERGDTHTAQEWWEGIGMFMTAHFKACDLFNNSGRMVEDTWADDFAPQALSGVWYTNDKMLGDDPMMPETVEGKIAFEMRSWVELECPGAIEAAKAVSVRGGPPRPQAGFGSGKGMVQA